MKNDLKVALAVFGLGVCVSCGEIVEEDISRREVFLLAPGDSAAVSTDSVSFWWEYVAGARDYQFRLVSPSFERPQRVLADSITSGNLLQFILSPGSYEWEVRGLNAGYATDFFYRSFRVDSTAAHKDISNQVVVLQSPEDGFVLKAKEVLFYWEELPDAQQYEFFLGNPDIDTYIVLDTTVRQDKVKLRLDTGRWEWAVRALADGTKTRFTKRTLRIVP